MNLPKHGVIKTSTLKPTTPCEQVTGATFGLVCAVALGEPSHIQV